MDMLDTLKLRPGAAVKIPFGFLVGERLGGTVVTVQMKRDSAQGTARVLWPDGETTTELVQDLEYTKPPRLTLRERLIRFLHSL